MTSADFDRRVLSIGLTSHAIPAARQCLVGGVSLYRASKDYGVGYTTLRNLVRRIESARICEHCGSEIK